MRPLTLEEMVIAVEGRVYGTISAPSVTSVSTDSRDVCPGALFIAIKGQNHDGHAFVPQVVEKGALAAVVSNVSGIPRKFHEGGRLIQVPDTVAALAKLAAWYRKQVAAQVIAVVGSNGKTSTKDMIATVLGRQRRGRAAKASFNNHIGVPLTLLSVEPPDEFVVLEIGTNHPGEIAALSRMANPDIAVITSIGEEHLEFFGDLDGVAGEEFSILSAMKSRAFIAMSEQAAAYAPAEMRKQFTTVTYGLDERADLRATEIGILDWGSGTTDRVESARVATPFWQTFKANGRFEYRLPILGAHNVINALAAVALGTRFRMSHEQIAEALARVKLPPMRMEWLRLGALTVLNDAYNANPSSMRTAFEAMDQLSTGGRKVFILGDMRELGEQSARCHQMVGRDAGRSTAQVVIAVGSMARVTADGATAAAGLSKRIYAFPSVEACAEKIGDLLEPGDLILLKASRGVRLERLMDALAAAKVG